MYTNHAHAESAVPHVMSDGEISAVSGSMIGANTKVRSRIRATGGM